MSLYLADNSLFRPKTDITKRVAVHKVGEENNVEEEPTLYVGHQICSHSLALCTLSRAGSCGHAGITTHHNGSVISYEYIKKSCLYGVACVGAYLRVCFIGFVSCESHGTFLAANPILCGRARNCAHRYDCRRSLCCGMECRIEQVFDSIVAKFEVCMCLVGGG